MDGLNQLNGGVPEEEEEESEDEEEDEEEEEDEDRDGVLEGGVAEEPEKGKEPRKAAAADLCLFITCTKALSFCPGHPIMKPGVTVQIGLDRTSKLEKVFSRYVEFCNDFYPADKVEVSDLEFIHSHVLSGHDNAEAASLMKNDRLQVRPDSSDERKEEDEKHRRQRDMDKEYFAQMRTLLPDQRFSSRQSVRSVDGDVIFDCSGLLPYVSGHEHSPGALPSDTLICALSFFIYKRCPGLGRLITKAKEEYKRRSVITVPEENKSVASDDEDDFELLQNLNNDGRIQNEDSSNAAQIENDEDEHVPEGVHIVRHTSDIIQSGGEAAHANDGSSFSSSVALPSHLPVIVLDHVAAEAFMLLLEYIYTNRCVPLGYEAFVQAAKNNQDHKLLYCKALSGPVAPFSYRPNRWPDGGHPAVSFSVAIAGIRLAEEFDMPRFSLMCEVAAGQLVNQYNAMSALEECGKQMSLTGNDLPRLRKEAMQSVLRSCSMGGGAMGIVQHALNNRCRLIVPSLFTGTMEAVKEAEEKKKTSVIGEKRDWQLMALQYFDNYDKQDERERERERRKRQRGQSPGEDSDDDDDDGAFGGFLGKAQRMTLKRMARHLRPGTSFDLLTRSRKSRRSAN